MKLSYLWFRNRFRWIGLIALLALSSISTPVNAQQSPDYLSPRPVKRLALVIGNANYSNFGPLPGSATDAKAMRDLLVTLGFDVDYSEDAKSFTDFVNLRLVPFQTKISEGDLVVVYFSGHGFAHGQTNYLVPTEAPATSSSAALARHYVPEVTVRSFLADKKPGALITLLDACRTMPQIVSESGLPGLAKGLAEPTSLGVDEVVGYAAAPGQAAYGLPVGNLSWFTAALAEYLPLEDIELATIQKRVNNWVKTRTFNQQVPWFSASIATDVILRPGEKTASLQIEAWKSVLLEGRRSAIEDYLATNRVGPFAAAARQWLADNPKDSRVTFTQFAPLLVEIAWQRASRQLRRLPGSLAVPRTAELYEGIPSDWASGVSAGQILAAQKRILLLDPTYALASKPGGETTVRTLRNPFLSNAVLNATTLSGEPIAISVAKPGENLVVGDPNFEAALAPPPDGPRGVVDGAALRAVLPSTVEAGRVGWATIATPNTPDVRSRSLNRLRALHAKFLLVELGVSAGRISIAEGLADTDFAGVRVRMWRQ